MNRLLPLLLACAAAFAQEGAKVVLVSRSKDNLEAALGQFPAAKHVPMAIVADQKHLGGGSHSTVGTRSSCR